MIKKPVIDLEYGFTAETFNAMMLALHALDYSDVSVITGKPIWGEVHGSLRQVTNRTLQEGEVRSIITDIYGPNAVSEIFKGLPVDSRYEVRADNETIALANTFIKSLGRADVELMETGGDGRRIPFRMNAAGAFTSRGSGIAISLRSIPIDLPRLEDMGLTDDLRKSINVEKGMCLVVGETGSGKSTLLAAVMREKILTTRNRKVIAIESPIEFDIQSLRAESSFAVQHEVGSHLPSFDQGIINALRQKPSDILVGEARDPHSIEAVIKAVETGHATFTTVHAASVSGSFRRIASEFGVENQSKIIFQLVSHVRVVVVQRLALSRTGGRRIPIREWLVFDDSFKDELLRMPSSTVLTAIDEKISGLGQTMRQQAIKTYLENQIAYGSLKSITGNLEKDEVDRILNSTPPEDFPGS